MHGPNDHSPTALELARRAFVTTVKATSGAQRGWAKLVDQARRAAAGVPLQLTESDSRVGKDRLQLRRIAYGSGRGPDGAGRASRWREFAQGGATHPVWT